VNDLLDHDGLITAILNRKICSHFPSSHCHHLQADDQVGAAMMNAVNIFGADNFSKMVKLDDSALAAVPSGGWGTALKKESIMSSKSGFQISTDSELAAAVSDELLSLNLRQESHGGGQVVDFTPPSRAPATVDLGLYQLSSKLRDALLPWAQIRRGKFLYIQGWGTVPEPHWLQPWVQKGIFPSPADVRAHGYTAHLFPCVDMYAAQMIRRTLADPTSALAR
jgi:hypothetical protein